MLIVRGNQFFRGCPVLYAVGSAAIGNVVVVDDRVVHHNRPVNVGSVNDGLIHMHHRGVIGKVAAPPFAAGKTDTLIAAAVVHAAVVAHVRTPVAMIEAIVAAGPVPIWRRPQRALVGSRHPGAGNPVVIPVAPGPVAGNPHQVRLGTHGLYIDR